MEGIITCFHPKCVSLPIRSFPLSRVSSLSQLRNRNSLSSSRSVPQRSLCVSSSSSDTLLAGGSSKEDERQSKVSSKKEGDDSGDLKHWLDKNGLPPCKVLLKERPAHDQNHKPIHYVAASEDLQVLWLFFITEPVRSLLVNLSLFQCLLLQKGDVAFSVPDSLVVTLERVLGNETIGISLLLHKVWSLFCWHKPLFSFFLQLNCWRRTSCLNSLA